MTGFSGGNTLYMAMSDKFDKILARAVLRLLRPLARILLRNGVPYGTLADLARKAYVDVAFHEFAPQGRKQTISRVSAMTGLTRKEVKRQLELGEGNAVPDQARYSRAIRVISGWLHDKQFQDGRGKPVVLPLEGKRKSFSALVRQYSGDIPVMAMLSMLEEAGNVSVSGGKVRLVRHAYVPGRDAAEKIEILGIDSAELIATIDHNLVSAPGALRFQRKVAYDNIDPEALKKIRKLSFRKAQSLLEQLDGQYAKNELEEGEEQGGVYVSMGIYYYEQEPPGE